MWLSDRATVCPHHRETNAKFRVVCECIVFGAKTKGRPRFVKHKQLKTSAKSSQKKKKFFVSVEHRAIPQFLISYWLCPLVWSTEIEKGREKEKVGGKQAKLNRRGSGRELDKGDETALTSSGRGSKRETEKGGAILLTSNGRGGAILLMSNGRGSKKEAQKEGTVLLTCNERERERNRELRHNFTDGQREREQERSRERRRNFTEEQLDNERERVRENRRQTSDKRRRREWETARDNRRRISLSLNLNEYEWEGGGEWLSSNFLCIECKVNWLF